jgi:anhydro-N-acetylmuramic acid kinase
MPFPAFPLDRPWRVLGLMSGTSADGVDAVVVEIDPAGFEGGRPFLGLRAHHHLAYPPELRAGVLEAAADRLAPGALCILQRQLGNLHAEAGAALAGAAPDFASLHGQTVQHHPGAGASLQLADPYVLALRLGCPVVWDLRRMDLALGGQGAPLVPLTEVWLRGRSHTWAALNLGGIANVTLWDGTRVQAWDAGPGMSLLDLAAERWLGLPFDPGGGHATGTVALELVDGWLTHPYFLQSPPKTTGRETFGAAWLAAAAPALEQLPLPDRLATLAAFSAEALARELRRGPELPRTGFVSGGGTHHGRLRAELAQRLPELAFQEAEDLPPTTREAVSWALLGAASAAGVPGTLPEVTGASRAAVLGSWAFPG